jgi:putative phosphoribosyl transferase
MSLSIASRCSAGRYLANSLGHLRHHGTQREDSVVLAIPRGGVPIGWEISQRLDLALDIIAVGKLTDPRQPGRVFGAVTSGGKPFLLQEIIDELQLNRATVEKIIRREKYELERREQAYRGDRLASTLEHKTVIVADDGITSGVTMQAALTCIREQAPAAIIITIPVASTQAITEFRALDLVDDIIYLATPEPFISIGHYYAEFNPVNDEDICALLSTTPLVGMSLAE